MDYKDALLTLRCAPVSENKVISRWYDADDANQDTLISLWESGFSDVPKGTLLRRRRQCYIDKIRWGMRDKRRDCQSTGLVSLAMVDFQKLDDVWRSKMELCRVDLVSLVSDFNKSIEDSEVKSFFKNLVDPSPEIQRLWEEKSSSNRTKNLDYIPPHSLLQLMGISKSKYLKYRQLLVDFLKDNLE